MHPISYGEHPPFMELRKQIDYSVFTDEHIVELILVPPHNEEAAAFLLYDRYNPLLHKVYYDLTRESFWFDDCIVELFMHLRGRDASWHPLSTFEWRSNFGCWLKGVALHKFQEVLPRLIENRGRNISIDNDDPEKTKVQLPEEDEEDYELRMRKVMLLEAIRQLEDDDQRFVMFKRLEGYNSNEIALLLQMRWLKYGIVKYGYKKDSKEKHIVVPDASYVNIRAQRAKKILRKLIVE